MMKHLFLLLSTIFFLNAHAQSNLPACTSHPFHYCYGKETYGGGVEVYMGEFLNDEKNGQGTYTWADSEKFVGVWRNNQPRMGTKYYPGGSKYVGEFKDWNRDGQGTYAFEDGKKYIGQFKKGNYHGYGTLYNSDGSIRQQGIWKDDQFVQAQTPPVKEVKPKPTVNNSQDIKRQKCIRLGLVPGSVDFQQCMN